MSNAKKSSMQSTKQSPIRNQPLPNDTAQQQIQPITITDLAIQFAFRWSVGMTMRLMTAPFDRVALLTTAEGELKRHRRLPVVVGFGGVWGCIRRIATKQGWDSFFRGYFADAISGDVCSILDLLVRGAVGHVFTSLVSHQQRESVKFAPAVIITLLLNFTQTCITSIYSTPRRIFLNSYIADIVAPIYPSWKEATGANDNVNTNQKSQNTIQTNKHEEKVVNANTNAEINKPQDTLPKQNKVSTTLNENVVEEGYFYANFSEAVRSVLNRCKNVTSSADDKLGILHNLLSGYILQPLRQVLHLSWSLLTLYIASGPLRAIPVQITWNLLAFVEVALLHPIDVIKTRLDVDASCSSSELSSAPLALPITSNLTSLQSIAEKNKNEPQHDNSVNSVKENQMSPRRYRGAFDCARSIVTNEGVSALFGGLRFRLLLAGISIATSMSIRYFVGDE